MGLPEVVCYHEAGHVVAYLAHGIPIDSVLVWESKENTGEWEGGLLDDSADSSVEDPRLRLIVKLVAPVTDEKRFGTGFRRGDKKDLDESRKIAEDSCPTEDVGVFLDEMLEEARRFVDAPDNWAAIERIAHRLMAKVDAAANQEADPVSGRQFDVSGEVLREWFGERGCHP
jgi:hypothetical protein